MGGKAGGFPDVLVIGGGPAGMMAAVAARLSGAGVALLEKNSRLGRKMAITGGGRCNFTNISPRDDFIENVPGNGRFVFSALSRFSGRDCVDFFAKIGVPPVVEEEGRVFPASGRAEDVVAALEKHLGDLGVIIVFRAEADRIIVEEGRCRGVAVRGGKVFYSKTLVLAAGGSSYPRTGSAGDGYRLARQAGHTVTRLLPGLVPICFSGPETGSRLQGLSLKDVILTLAGAEGKRAACARGDVVFTHFGISGPAALKLSREVALRSGSGGPGLTLLLDVMPGVREDHLAGQLLSLASGNPRKTTGVLLKKMFPERLALLLADALPPGRMKKSGEAGREYWRGMARLAKGLPLQVSGSRPLEEAMVTVGGVSTREVDPRTMASRLVDRLYFAGEVLDVDAYTGGFNMQVAFSTGWVAGRSAAEKAKTIWDWD